MYHDAVVITTAQLHSTKPELRFCAGSNPACGMLKILDGEDLWQMVPSENKAKCFSMVNHTTKTIRHNHQFKNEMSAVFVIFLQCQLM